MFLIYLSYICRSLTIADNYKYSTFFAYHNKVHLDILKMYEGCRYILNIFNLRSFRYFSTVLYTITYIIHINILQLLSYSENYIKIRGEGPYLLLCKNNRHKKHNRYFSLLSSGCLKTVRNICLRNHN